MGYSQNREIVPNRPHVLKQRKNKNNVFYSNLLANTDLPMSTPAPGNSLEALSDHIPPQLQVFESNLTKIRKC